MTLTARADNLWTAEDDLFAFGIHFPIRMTVVRLKDGGLWLCSPVAIDDSLAAELDELGPVRHIVAPNLFHHVHLRTAMQRYPDAKVHGAPGLAKKRRDVAFTSELGPEAPVEWRDDIEQVSLRAMPAVGEVVFFHRASGTLIATDLIMNVHRVKGLLGRIVFWAEGCWRRAAVPRLFRWLVKHRAQHRAELQRVSGWPIQRLIVAHGEIVEDGADALVRRELAAFGGFPIPVPANV